MTSPLYEHLLVSDSAIHGLGLFTRSEIESGTWIGRYEGEETMDNGMHVLWVQQEDESWLGYDGNNLLRFLNHSEQPNCELDGQELYAARNIAADEELTIDYGEWFEPDEDH